jgi:hypothetical protein
MNMWPSLKVLLDSLTTFSKRDEVRKLVITQRIREYQTLIQACQLAEQSLAAVAVSKQVSWKRKRDEGNSKGEKEKETNY